MSPAALLVVEHEAACPPAWLGEWLADTGVALDLRRPYLGEPLPATLDEHSGLVVLGGSMGADDDARHPWLTEVKELLRRAADDAVPALGVCLGHQLAAVAFGGRVERNPRGQQVGVLEVGWTAQAAEDPLLGPVAARRPTRAVQWNDDIVVEPPPGSVVLAHTRHDELQAARFAPTVWGVQWHPEVGEEVARMWAEHDRDDAAERGIDLESYVAQVAAATQELRGTWVVLARALAGLTRTRAEAVS